MKRINYFHPALVIVILSLFSCKSDQIDFSKYPSATLSNETVRMKVFLPDAENGMYRGTRFDRSGVISSVKYKGHEYFGYWRDTHDPLIHDHIAGPVEGFNNPGLGYEEAVPGEGFIRIGVGILQKEEEESYQWSKTYNLLDPGEWSIEKGEDWISFTQTLAGNFGYKYIYKKTIKLKEDGFTILHHILNNGSKVIETDQFNHNFFMIDHMHSGPGFELTFPYQIQIDDDSELVEVKNNKLVFVKPVESKGPYLHISGFSDNILDHKITVENKKTGAGVTFTVDRPLEQLIFWASKTTLCPENYIQITVPPNGGSMDWTSEYTLFVQD